MTPDLRLAEPPSRELAHAPLPALLVFPTQPRAPKRRTLWVNFLNDLTYLLPAFCSVLGYLLATGQAPFAGAVLVTLSPVLLALRIHASYLARRERRQMRALRNWYRAYRLGFENQRGQ